MTNDDTITLQGDALRDAWTEVWTTYHADEVQKANLQDRDVNVNLTWLSKHMEPLEATLDDDPLSVHREAVHTLRETLDATDPPWLRLRQDLTSRRITVPDLGAHWAHQFVAVDATIRSIGPLESHALEQHLRCQRCQNKVTVRQNLAPWKSSTPYYCGGCEKKAQWSVVDDPIMVDVRRAKIAPRIGEEHSANQHILTLLPGPLASEAVPGQEVTLHGYLTLKGEETPYTPAFISTDLDTHTAQDHDAATSDDLDQWQGLVETHGDSLLEKVTETITPGHHGDLPSRKSMTLSLFTNKHAEDRETIHVLFVGDPGTGKSRLLRVLGEQMPKSVHANATRATKAGLTGTVESDREMGGKRLEPGALAIADEGACLIDEMDKADDWEKLHEAMAQQTISLALAGSVVTMPARCSILAAANPEKRRWNANEPVAEQITLPPTIVSRFDAIHLFVDRPDEERDRAIADKVLGTEHDAGHGIEPELVGRVAWRLAQSHEVDMPEASMERLKEAFVRIRQEHNGPNVPIGQRQLASMRRFAKARARFYLRDEVTLVDAEWAAAHVETWIRRIAEDDLHNLDIDFVQAPEAASQKQRVRKVEQAIRDNEPVTVSELAEHLGWDAYTVEDTVEMLKKDGVIYRPSADGWAVVE